MAKTEAQSRATQKYDAKSYDKITLRIRNDGLDQSGISRDIIQKAADASGMSLNSFILQAIAEKINKK